MDLLAQRSPLLAASNATAARSPVLEFQLELPAEQPRPTQWPKITLVTAVYNGEALLDATIRSILNQGYPNLEYIVVDDGSTDLTPEIIRAYAPYLNRCIQQPNQGLFAALNAGFAASSGEIMGWLNSSDLLQINSLFTVATIFRDLPQVEWITGRPTKISATGMTIDVLPVPHWSRMRFLAGANKYIQQESTFWRRSLWQRAGGSLSTEFRAEGDFELWVRFFRHAKLHSVEALVGGYRLHDHALSSSDMARYDRNCDLITTREVAAMKGPAGTALRLFRRIDRAVKPIPKVRGLWQRLAIQSLYRFPAPDLPPVIHYGEQGWQLRT